MPCLTFLMLLFLSCDYNPAEKARPIAINGVIDLRETNLESMNMLRLRGEWEFYWNQLLTPADFDSTNPVMTGFFEVPGFWVKKEINGFELPSLGYCTYRLGIKNIPAGHLYCLKINRIYCSYRLWINGELKITMGEVATAKEDYYPLWRPRELFFNADSGEIEIILQVSNFDHIRGGIMDDIEIGTPAGMSEGVKRLVAIDIFGFGILLMMIFYLFGIFIIQANDPIPLYFCLACLTTLTHLVVNGEMMILKVFPEIPWRISIRVDFMSNYLRAAFFVLFLGTLFRDYISKYFTRLIVIWGGSMALFVLVAPSRIFSATLGSFKIITVLAFVYVIIGLIRASLGKNREAVYSLLGTIILFLFALNDMLYDSLVIRTFRLFPFGLFFFVFFHSFLLSLRFSKLYNSVNNLSKKLLTADVIKTTFLEDSSRTFRTPLEVFIRNLDAEKGFILVQRRDIWYVGIGISLNENQPPIRPFYPLERLTRKQDQKILSLSVVNHVIGHKEMLVLHNACKEGAFTGDPCIRDRKIMSLICVPLKLDGKLTGLLYLENNSSSGVFDTERVEIIDMLDYQLAILLENVEIYQALERLNRTLENKVRHRTNEIEKQKDEISTQKDEIMAQRDLLAEQKKRIEEQNKGVTDSIKYAGRIQKAIMPADDLIKFFFPKHFILYMPRDIVSGDFYWLGRRDNKVILAVIDCTGHGVPGAFMSVLGSSLLNEIISRIQPLYAHEILNELRDSLIISLHQTGTMYETKDGMDLAMCIFEPGSMNIQFAGAYNSLLIIRDTEMKEIKGDPMPVGIGDKAGTSFTNHELELQKGDSLYLYTDGIADQFGGPENKSLGFTRLKEWLADMQDKIMFEQRSILEDKFNKWKGTLDQMDDVLVMGIKI